MLEAGVLFISLARIFLDISRQSPFKKVWSLSHPFLSYPMRLFFRMRSLLRKNNR
jgi:hypothetical protein